jgi:geranylgeranyl diphosphate synthase, type II
MDKADMRRGQPTVHKKWNENVAILSGDAMMVRSVQLMGQTKFENKMLLINELCKVALEVCEGQQWDMNYETDSGVAVDQYLEMIRLKTSVLLASSMKIGAIIGGANPLAQQSIYDFGLDLGLAFQLQDDLLDAFGNAGQFGKEIGGDIKANKKTFLMLTAHEMANGDQGTHLDRLFCNGVSPEERVKGVLEIYNSLGIKQITENRIEAYFTKAYQSFEKIDVAADRKQPLLGVVEKLRGREH